jgi:hypothetical protein
MGVIEQVLYFFLGENSMRDLAGVLFSHITGR